MKTVTSISGGKSSAYIAANYPSDLLVFALVCIQDATCTPKDKKLVQMVSDRIGREFIATAEDDTILHTIFDLEQYLGQRIDWVAGLDFEDILKDKGGWLPNVQKRYCTVEMKLRPMFQWWQDKIGEPVEMRIGFRSGEENRATRMLERVNEDGLIVQRGVVGQHSGGRNKWADIGWQKPAFPMIDNGIRRDDVVEYWKDKPVRFAERNNCIGCFHRSAMLLRMMADDHPKKFDWFVRMEEHSQSVLKTRREQKGVQVDERGRVNGTYKGTWKEGLLYSEIQAHNLQMTLSWDDFTECDSGHCGL